jgi:fructokinase
LETRSRLATAASPALSRNGTVVLFGEVLADIFPDRTVLGGAPFNVARHLKAFGLNPVIITRLGNDTLRDEVLSIMAKNGMETLGIQLDKSYPTGRVKVHLHEAGHDFEILPLQAYDFIHPAVARMALLAANPALIYFGTLAQRCPVSERALKTLLRSTDAAKFLDINLRAPWYDKATMLHSLQNTDILKLNNEELEILAEKLELSGSPQNLAKELIKRFCLEQVIITCGAAGAWQMNRQGKVVEIGADNQAGKLMDTVGAGDAFAAVSILGSLRNWRMARTLERAHAFAGAICEIRGAIPDQTDFYQPFIEEWEIRSAAPARQPSWAQSAN